MQRQLLAAIRPLPTPLRPELLSLVYNNLEQIVPTLQDPVMRAQGRAMLCGRHLNDLAVPAVDGLTLKEVAIDSVEWIEAVGQTVLAYKAAIADESMTEVQEAYAATLADCFEKTEDTGLKQYLQIHLTKLVKKMQKAGTLSEAVVEAARRFQEQDMQAQDSS